MKFVRNILCLAAIALVAGCASKKACCSDEGACCTEKAVATETGGTKHEITPADSGKTIAAQVGDTIVFSAKENPSTGYAWSAKFDEAALEPGASDWATSEPKGDPPKVGAPGMRTMAFKVKAPGKSTLALQHSRGWEKDTPPAEKCEVVIEAAK